MTQVLASLAVGATIAGIAVYTLTHLFAGLVTAL